MYRSVPFRSRITSGPKYAVPFQSKNIRSKQMFPFRSAEQKCSVPFRASHGRASAGIDRPPSPASHASLASQASLASPAIPVQSISGNRSVPFRTDKLSVPVYTVPFRSEK